MSIINFCMNLGTLLAGLATVPQILAVFKDRTILKGYSPLPCAALCIAMILFGISFWEMGLITSVICEIPPIIFWGSAAVFSFKYR